MPKLTTLPIVTVALALLMTLIISPLPSAAATPWHNFTALAGCRKGITTAGLSNIKRYFQLFGYLNSSYHDFSDDFDDYLESAVKTYQQNFNLNATGELDSPTLRHVVLPRCGNPDAVNGTSTMRSGRRPTPAGGKNPHFHSVAHYSFFPNQPRWPPGRTQLSYAFLPENQLSEAFRGVFRRAFQRWSEVTPLTFVESAEYSGSDIQIGFHRGEHGDGEPFDGVLGTLAHAFSPPSGRLHLDNDENWVADGELRESSAVDLESVAVHEIGHLLGLGHSSVEDAIMYPTISTGTRKVELASDDILGIQELYGSNPNYNGSDPVGTARGERDTSGVPRVEHQLWGRGVLLAVGLLPCLLLL